NEAYVGGEVTLSAPLIQIEAIAPSASTYGATATSGVGDADSVTVAGSLAVNIVVTGNTASVKGAVAVGAGNNVHVTASSNATDTANALVAKQVFDPATAVDSSADTITLPYKLKKSDGSDVADNDEIKYKTNGGDAIGGLTDDTTYFAIIPDSAHPEVIKLAATSGGAAIDLDGSAATETEHSLKLETDTDPGDSTGVGASIAINVADDDVVAELADSATLSGARDLVLRATTTNAMTTKAENGSSGGTAITAGVGLSFSLLTTRAVIGTGDPLTLTGMLDAEASQTATVTTKTAGDAVGADTGVGIALGLGVAVHTVEAFTNRAITTTGIGALGKIRFAAYGTSSNITSATASAAGAEGEDDDSTGKDTNDKADDQLAQGNKKSTDNGGSSSGQTETKKASTSEDGGDSVSVAAAIAFNVSLISVNTGIPSGIPINAGGPLDLDSQGRAVARAKADGSANKSSTAIGAAVAVNYAKAEILSSIGEDATVESNGVSLNASIRGPPSTQHEIEATAKSGAGGEDTGIAGALAINIVEGDTTAIIYQGTTTDIDAGTGAVSVTASHLESDKAKAEADAEGDDVGVGASVALNILSSTDTKAEIEDGVALSGGAAVTVTASSTRVVETEVKAGAKGGTAVTPAVALALDVDDVVVARIGSGSGTWMPT